MFQKDNKKNLILYILDILKDYSDINHPLLQKDIVRLLQSEYQMSCDRRSVKNNILSLIDFGYDINMENGYYLETREFEDAELRMLIDSVLFSKTFSTRQAKNLINKLKGMSNKYFNAKVAHINNLPELQHAENKQVLYSLDTLNDAISQKRKVSFIYNSYGTDFKLHPRREEVYIVNPYQLVANNGRYYLIGNYDKYDNVSHYRVDRITNVTILNEKVKDPKLVQEWERGFSLPKHMAEHIYMFSGKSIGVKLKVRRSLMTDLIDWFGKDFQILNEQEEFMEIHVKCNETAMKFWALQYGPYVEVLEPATLRNTVKESVRDMYFKYFCEED